MGRGQEAERVQSFAGNALACRIGLATLDRVLANDLEIVRQVAAHGRPEAGRRHPARLETADVGALLLQRVELARALAEYEVAGVETTIPFCHFVMEHPSFRSGQFSTHFVAEHFTPEALAPDAFTGASACSERRAAETASSGRSRRYALARFDSVLASSWR